MTSTTRTTLTTRFKQLAREPKISSFRIARHTQTKLRQLMMLCGVDVFCHSGDDRRVLETLIFPHVIERGKCGERSKHDGCSERDGTGERGEQDDSARLLFVGCARYTKGYARFFDGLDYWTLEPNPQRARFGAHQHVVGSLQDIERHFAASSFDAIICNGVFGWGLNAPAEVEQAFSGCHGCLQEGGMLVIGWNDTARRRPFPLEQCRSLRSFKPYVFPALATTRYLTDTLNRHTYDFYLK